MRYDTLSLSQKKKKIIKIIYCQIKDLGLILFVMLKDEFIVKTGVEILFYLFTIFCYGFNWGWQFLLDLRIPGLARPSPNGTDFTRSDSK